MNSSESQSIKYKVVYSRRRTLAISVRQDASVIVRVPLRTPDRIIEKLVRDKSAWILRHTCRFRAEQMNRTPLTYSQGSVHMFRGQEHVLNLIDSKKYYYRFSGILAELGLPDPGKPEAVKNLLHRAYREEAQNLFPEMLKQVMLKHEKMHFRPSGLTIRSMKRRWGSCSSKGKITLNTELIRLPDRYIEYVLVHELCHLIHHNHGTGFYELLSELFPGWKEARKQLKRYII